ncbi:MULTISPECIES: glycoside hydrolase domain-containing protein [unclassified Streptomyces]|uniref:glycoside hydrolase domain-containing protein n=1 Tax=unclassified Streptomyces TaxID=2593676 RepID=UPI0036F539DE
MRFRPVSLLLAAALAAAGATPALAATAAPPPDRAPALVTDPTAYVDPLIGTRNGGNVFPGAVVPFGMFSFSPENTRGDATRTAAPGGYHYDATRIRGFSLTHMSGTGCAGGSGDIPFFPYAGEVTTSPASDTKDAVYAAGFRHADERAEPGHYRVALDSGVTADLTATARTGSARFTLKLHYMPSVSNAWGGAAETLEMSTADYALSRLATAAGEKDTAAAFARRAQWWQNTFNVAADQSGGYIASRKADGSWVTGFIPATGNGFVEGTAAQYTWMVPHDPAGLFAAMGGREEALRRLDAFFHTDGGDWAFTGAGGEKSELDNEPSINVPYLYAYAGAPYKTQETVRAAMRQLWSTAPGGIPGNDDLGAMSAWYVFSALGMYPQVPSRAELVLASPLFERIEIHRPYGNDISVRAAGAAAGAPYVHSLRVDGRTSDRPWLPASFVQHGGRLDYTLSTTPDRSWGSDPADAPPSFREGEQPYQIGVGPTAATVPPGGSTTTTVRAVSLDGGTGPGARFHVETPDGITAAPADGTIGSGSREITLTAAQDTPQGFYDAQITVTSGDTAYRQPVVLKVAAPGTLLAAYDTTGVSDDSGDHDEADYDGGGWSYSRQALAAAGLAPGAHGTVAGLTFTWPNSPAGRPDNASAAGQTVRLASPAARLSFVGSAVNGDQQAEATVTYDDGTSATVDLSFTDWTVGGGGGTVRYGNEVVARTAYRNVAGADRDPVATYVFATKPFTAPDGKRITSVRLPRNADLHVFTLAVG